MPGSLGSNNHGRLRLIAPLLAVAAALAVACGSGAPPTGPVTPLVVLTNPDPLLDMMTSAGLGCTGHVYRLGAGGAKVATCGPIASIPKSNISIGVYPSSRLAESGYQANCDGSGGWSLYRRGDNWRGVITWESQKVPRDVAQRIADALHTDLHAPCASPSPGG